MRTSKPRSRLGRIARCVVLGSLALTFGGLALAIAIMVIAAAALGVHVRAFAMHSS